MQATSSYFVYRDSPYTLEKSKDFKRMKKIYRLGAPCLQMEVEQALKPGVFVSKKSTDDGQGPREEDCIKNYWLFTVDCHNSTETKSQLVACTSIQTKFLTNLFNQIIILCIAFNIKNIPEFIKDLNETSTHPYMRLTFDILNMYTNIPIEQLRHATENILD